MLVWLARIGAVVQLLRSGPELRFLAVVLIALALQLRDIVAAGRRGQPLQVLVGGLALLLQLVAALGAVRAVKR